jgi:hypothetical protein
VLCNGLPVQEVVVSPVPFPGFATQYILAKIPLAPVDSMVSLFKDVPVRIAAVRAMLPSRPIFIRQVCRGNLCVACEDDSATCIRSEVVGLQPLIQGGYSANVSSLKRDVLYRFFAPDCAMLLVSGLDLEYASANTAMISSAIDVVSVRTACATNTSYFMEIPVD